MSTSEDRNPRRLDGIAFLSTPMRSALLRLMLSCAVLAPASPLHAAEFPSRPVRLIVPFSAGGFNDLLARLVGARLSERMKQQFIVDNRAGANTIIGTDLTAKAAPDGYTLLVIPGGHAINPSMYRKLPYDTAKDFSGVAMIGHSPYVLVVNPSLRVTSVAGLMALAKSKPRQISYASSGIGNVTHLAVELIDLMAGSQMVHVPYKGGSQLMPDLLSGTVPVAIMSFAMGFPSVKGGKLTALGVTTAKRSPVLPDLPTLSESGLPGYEVSGWYGLVAPSATPKPVLNQLNAAVRAVVSAPELGEKLAQMSVDVVDWTPAQFDRYIVAEIVKWQKVVKNLGIELQ